MLKQNYSNGNATMPELARPELKSNLRPIHLARTNSSRGFAGLILILAISIPTVLPGCCSARPALNTPAALPPGRPPDRTAELLESILRRSHLNGLTTLPTVDLHLLEHDRGDWKTWAELLESAR